MFNQFIELFKTGTHTDGHGHQRRWTDADLLSELIETRYKDAVKWLQQVSVGKVSLPETAQKSAQTDHIASLHFATGVQVNTDGY